MMMTNLFSIFDPSLSVFSFSLVVVLLVVFILPCWKWMGGLVSYFFFIFYYSMKKEIDYVLSSPKVGLYSFIGSVFIIIALCNFLALFPHIFSISSHLLFTLPLSYSFWLGIIIFSWVSSFKMFLSHLIPVGTPMGLMSFMVVVELLSNFIRPLALTFRLTANMMAGHLLMSLIGGSLISLSFSFLLVGSFFQSLLVFMELGVSLIQAYVFSTLLLLYISEGSH